MNGDKAKDGPNVVPLRTILRNFLNLVESYEARRNGGLDSYETEFQELKKLSENLKSDPGHLCKEGERTVNRKKNRYKDILPYDFSRVPLRAADDAPGSDYINANFIKGASGSSAYIACQGPLPHTVNDFWRMVVECEVQVIVMACNEHESGKHKCENYWVADDGVEREFGDVVVWLKKCRQVCPDFLVRTMRMRYKNSQGETEERNVCQFHYSAWPDHGVPTKVRPLLDMVRLIRDCQTSETLPVLVHCSAGCGRTGTICAIDYVWGLLRLGRLTADFSLFKLVGEMRRQRIAMVQTKDQYVLVHRAVKELFQEQLRIIDSHPYANVDGNGFPVDMKSDLREPTYEVLDARPSKTLESDKISLCDTSNSIVVSVSNVNVAGQSGDSVPAAQYVVPQRSDKEDNIIPARPSKLNGASEVVISRDRTPSKLEKRNSGTPPLSSSSASGQEASVLGIPPDTKSEHQVSPSPTSSWDNRKSPAKGSSSGAYGLLQNPFKSIFGRTSAKDDSKKSGMLPKLSRAKSDVSTRFQAFTASFGSRSGSAAPSSPADRSTTSPEKTEAKGKAEASDGSGETFVYNQDGKLTQVVSGVKRSKSLKITAEALAKLSGFKLDSSKNSKGKRSNTKSPSPAISSVSSPTPAEVAPSSSKFVPSKTEEKSSTQNGYDYDIDDRSHLRQRPISSSALDKDSETKIVRVEEPSKNGSQDKSRAKPHNYANVTLFPHGPSYRNPRSSKEMEDIDSPKKSSLGLKKKSDTVNAKMLYSSKVYPKENGYSSVFPNRRSSGKDTKDPSFTLLFNNSSSSISKPNASPSTAVNSTFVRPGIGDSVNKIEADEDDRIYIEAISSDVHVTTSLFGDEDSGNGKQEISSREGSPDKPLLRRRVPKTNPYANYPSCASGSSRYAAKIPLEKSLSDEKTVVYGENSNSYTRDVCIPNLRTSQGGGSIGNSSTSSSSSPKNSLPSTPTQSVDILYSNVFNRSNSGGSTATSGSSHPASSSVPTRSNFSKESTVATTGNQRPASLLKQDETDRPGTSKQQQPINPKLNALRLGVGRSERRNSFRQAVWKEAQPTSTNVDDDRAAPGSSSRTDGRPLYNNQAKFSVADLVPHSTAKKYEPIWPNQGAPHGESPALNGSLNHKIGHGPSDKGHDVQMKIDEIKSMLEELNTTRKSANQPGTLAQDKTAVPGSSNIKQHQSLRAPSRTQYQQGLSCFTFKKPCSYESLVDAIHSEDDRSSFDLMTATGDQARVDRLQKDSGQNAMVNGKLFSERCNNEYVTLNQCRSPVEDTSRREAHFFPESNSVPVPPPRAKRLHVNGTAPGNSKGWNQSKISTDSHYSQPGPVSASWQTTGSYQNNLPGPGPSDQSSLNTSSNPKAIIKALGLFQPKAATVRTRLANGAEARDNKAKGLSNGYTVSVDCERVEVRNTGKGGNGIVNPFAMEHDRLTSGATVLSKRQYL